MGPRNRRKVLPWQQLLPGIAEKLISSNLCPLMGCKEPIKLFRSPRNRRKVLPWQHLLPGIVESTPIRAGVWNAKNPQKCLYIGPRKI